MGFTLHASSLWRKHGFQDGDLFDDILEDHGLYDTKTGEDEIMFCHQVIVRCVERFLLPALPEPVETEAYSTSHNPMRVKSWRGDSSTFDPPDVQVDVSDEQVIAVAREIKAEIEEKRRAAIHHVALCQGHCGAIPLSRVLPENGDTMCPDCGEQVCFCEGCLGQIAPEAETKELHDACAEGWRYFFELHPETKDPEPTIGR